MRGIRHDAAWLRAREIRVRMRQNLYDNPEVFVDPQTDEVNATALAENTAATADPADSLYLDIAADLAEEYEARLARERAEETRRIRAGEQPAEFVSAFRFGMAP